MLPQVLSEHIGNVTLAEHAYAYFCADKQGTIRRLGGDWAQFGFHNLAVDEPVSEELFFLAGFLPCDGPNMLLKNINLEADKTANIYIFTESDNDWVLLLDVTYQEKAFQLMQQKVNELSLLRDQQNRLIERSFANEEPSEWKHFPEAGEHREVTILFADIRNFTAFSSQQAPEPVMRTLNAFLRVMVVPILDEAGIIDKIIGDSVMAIFGVLPSAINAKEHAVRAALRLHEAVLQLSSVEGNNWGREFSLGIGIASGNVLLGILKGKERRFFGAVGSAVNLAAALERRAQARQILIDETTFNHLDATRDHFRLEEMQVHDSVQTIYKCIV